MIRLLSSDVWTELKRLGAISRRRMAAVAYVTDASQLRFGIGDVLIADASDQAIRTAQTSASALAEAAKRGAELYSYPGLHAKVFLFDRVAVVGSSNISTFSRTYLLEAAIMTDHPSLVSQVRAVIDALQRRSTKIDKKFIGRIQLIPVERTPWRYLNARVGRIAMRTSEPGTWLVGIKGIDEERYRAEEKQIKQGMREAVKHRVQGSSTVEWLRFIGSSSFRRNARVGDSLIQIWTPLNAKYPSRVFKHATILYRQEEGNRTRIFIEEYAVSEQKALAWAQFKHLAHRVGLPDRIGRFSLRKLSEDQSQALSSLWPK